MILNLRFSFAAFALLAVASPAAAQWTRVSEVPASTIYSVWASGDTIAAGADTSVYLSTNGGVTWKGSTQPVAGTSTVQAVRVRNGRLYAGTFGQGVFVSDDFGDTWQAYNQGLVGGILNSQLDLADFEVRGDSLYAATLGAGVYVRGFAPGSTWSHFGEEFEPNQASTVNALGVGGTRLIAAAGGNGSVFHRDPGEPDWTISWLNNVGLHPGTQARSVAWTGSGWVVGAGPGVFHSAGGQEPWTLTDTQLGSLINSSFARWGNVMFGAFDILTAAVIELSSDNGASWIELESFIHGYIYKLAMSGNLLYAGRENGLWRRTTSALLSAPAPADPVGLRFSLAGPQPVRDQARFRIELPEAGNASIEIFDVAGRHAAERVQGFWSAGVHELSWDARGLGAGVYQARLTAGGRHAALRLVHIR